MVESLIKAGAFDFTGFSRKSLLNGYEAVLDGAANRSKNSLAGQFSLFDNMAVSQEVQLQTIHEIGEYPQLQLLMLEKEMLGVYLSGHPLERYRRAIKKLGFDLSRITVETDESGESILNEEVLALDNKDIQFIGIITSVRKKATKSGTMMAFLTVEDLYSSVTALVFPAALTKFSADIYEDAIVLVTGKLSIRDEEQPTVLVNTIASVSEDAEEEQCSVFLRITEENREQLPQFLQAHAGKRVLSILHHHISPIFSPIPPLPLSSCGNKSSSHPPCLKDGLGAWRNPLTFHRPGNRGIRYHGQSHSSPPRTGFFPGSPHNILYT